MPQTDATHGPAPSGAAPAIVWFRQDLRLRDNPALTAAVATGRPLIGLFIMDNSVGRAWGGASRWWLHQALEALNETWTTAGGSALVLRQGAATEILPALAKEANAASVHWNRMYEPAVVARDTDLKATLKAAGVEVDSHKGGVLFEPWEIQSGSGDPYRVFTPFWRACRNAGLPTDVLDAPTAIQPYEGDVTSDALSDWDLLPTQPDWAGGLRESWRPGASGAQERLSAFLDQSLTDYAEGRDFPAKPGTSRLSPHLHWGEISPRDVTAATLDWAQNTGADAAADKFLSEIGWREFSTSLLFHNPTLPADNLQTKFDAFPWREDASALRAWQMGNTGYPIVDAGMRELWATGWMHNRVRMIVGSFLVKHLLLDWRAGEAWFWDTLVDADLANNAAGWQWIAGSGADAAPYFRIFNPVTQGERYDPQGEYVRRWVPELSRLPNKLIHKPWTAPQDTLIAAGVQLGDTYPHPVVDHKVARERALAAFESLKTAA